MRKRRMYIIPRHGISTLIYKYRREKITGTLAANVTLVDPAHIHDCMDEVVYEIASLEFMIVCVD